MSPFISLLNSSWKGSTANSQIATARELEELDWWWSKGVRNSFCMDKNGVVSACPPGTLASQALLCCPRLNRPSHRGRFKSFILDTCRGSSVLAALATSWFCLSVHHRQRHVRRVPQCRNWVVLLFITRQGLEGEIVSCARIIPSWFLLWLLCLCLIPGAASEGPAPALGCCLSPWPGLSWTGLYCSRMHVNVPNMMFLTKSVSFDWVPL